MKTWQMIKELTENPNKKFKYATDHESGIVAIVKGGIELISVDGIKKSESLPLHLGFMNQNWEEVKEPVDFITAFNALQHDRKNIYCILNGKKHLYEENCTGTFKFREDCIAEGEWYVE